MDLLVQADAGFGDLKTPQAVAAWQPDIALEHAQRFLREFARVVGVDLFGLRLIGGDRAVPERARTERFGLLGGHLPVKARIGFEKTLVATRPGTADLAIQLGRAH